MVRRKRRERGFSIVELMIVVAVVVVVGAMALPNITSAVYNIRLRSSASTLSGMMQRARMQAVSDNKYYFVRYAVIQGSTMVWVSSSSTSTAPAAGEPQAQLSGNVRVFATGAPSGLTFSWNPVTSRPPAFNARGLPCIIVGSRCLTANPLSGGGGGPVGFLLYLNDTRPLGTSGWAGVTLSPAGRTQTFYYSGSNWGS